MKKIRSKKYFILYPLILVLLLSLTACSEEQDALTEGDCPGVVAFTDIPKEFTLLGSEFMDQFTIRLSLKNITTEKYYSIVLNKENNFRQELSLHPGTYKVVSSSTNSNFYNLEIEASAESLTFAPDQHAVLTVTVSDPEALTQRWMEVQPMPEILLADKFSGMIQINRKVIPLQDILPELTLDGNQEEGTLNPLMNITLTDSEKGVKITLQNPTESPLPWSSCTVTAVTATGNTVLFPDGISIGIQTDKVCHQATGLYGEPTRFTGTSLFGWGLATTSAIYSDPATGNRITLDISPSGSYVRSITYELGIYE